MPMLMLLGLGGQDELKKL